MHAHSAVELRPAEVVDLADCQRWLDQLAQHDADPLAAIDRLLHALHAADSPASERLAMAELVRPAHLRAIEQRMSGVHSEAVPMSLADRRQLAQASASLALGRDLYDQVHRQALDASDGEARAVIPGAADSLDTILPMIRAVDYQARLIIGLQLNGFAVAAPDWERLCAAAQAVRVSTFQDVVVPDEAALLPSATGRALFIYPLLVELARPAERSTVEKWLIARLARRWAAKVGFRLEPGSASRASPNGPVLALTATRVVRLDAHRLMSRLMAQRAEIEALAQSGAPRLPRGMSLAGTRALLAQLVDSWSPGLVLNPAPDARLGERALRFGLPVLPVAGQAQSMPSIRSGAIDSPWQPAADRASIYGRFESHDTLRGARLLAQPAGGLATWAGGAERAMCVSCDGHQAVFERSGAAPVALGDLVAIFSPERAGGQPGFPQAGAGQPAGVQFGRVTALSQPWTPSPGETALQRVQVLAWAGRAAVVEVRAADEVAFQTAVLLAGDVPAGEPETLLLPSGRFSRVQSLMLREAGCDRVVHLEAVLESRRGFVRVRLRRAGV